MGGEPPSHLTDCEVPSTRIEVRWWAELPFLTAIKKVIDLPSFRTADIGVDKLTLKFREKFVVVFVEKYHADAVSALIF